MTNDEKLYEVLSSLEISYPYYPTMSVIREEHLTQKRKDLLISRKNENDIKELFKIIDLYIASNNEIKNFSRDGDVCYLLEHNNLLYQFSYNLIENKIRKLSELTIDKNNELKDVIRFDDLNTFYNKFKKFKIRKREKKD